MYVYIYVISDARMRTYFEAMLKGNCCSGYLFVTHYIICVHACTCVHTVRLYTIMYYTILYYTIL